MWMGNTHLQTSDFHLFCPQYTWIDMQLLDFFSLSFSRGDEVQLAGHGCYRINEVTKENGMANVVWLLYSFTPYVRIWL